MKGTDAIIVPTAPLNPTIEQVTKEPIKVNSYQGTYTNFVNLADMSALAIPAGFRSDGLPFGITLLSDKFNDYALLELASRYLKTNSLRTCGVSKRKFQLFMMYCISYQNQLLKKQLNWPLLALILKGLNYIGSWKSRCQIH